MLICGVDQWKLDIYPFLAVGWGGVVCKIKNVPILSLAKVP